MRYVLHEPTVIALERIVVAWRLPIREQNVVRRRIHERTISPGFGRRLDFFGTVVLAGYMGDESEEVYVSRRSHPRSR